jgi:hypothetical protein
MTNREIYTHDPKKFELLNNGVAKVRDADSEEALRTLRHELETFICEGQYEKGLRRLLGSYLKSLGDPEQPAAWVSGFFGSGKSHLVKMLRYLWVDYTFPDGATARGLANLPAEVSDLFEELSTAGRRHGGLHAVSGTLGEGVKSSVRLAFLGLIFKSAGLPSKYPLARFTLWLKEEDLYEDVRHRVEQEGKDFDREVRNMAVSKTLAEGLLGAEPSLGNDVSDVHQLLRRQFPKDDDVTIDEMKQSVYDVLADESGQLPCTLVALDEIQQYIGDDSDRTYAVQEVTQACVSEFGGRLLFVGTGQNALTGVPNLAKLAGRYRIQIQLSDADVETVTRKTVLSKKPAAKPEVEEVLETCSGEISRHLQGTDFEPKPEDRRHHVEDYPLLPTRRRFWERVLRAVDEAGTKSQLRTQLKVVDEAVKTTADDALGTVVAGDFVYDELRSDLLRSGVLPQQIDTEIERLREEEPLDARLCALAFLIGKLPREEGADTGLRATPDTFADLVVRDLRAGSSALRNEVEERLEELEQKGLLMRVEGEYRMQTKESAEWTNEFRKRHRKIRNQPDQIASVRADALRRAAGDALDDVGNVLHGDSNEPRKVETFFTQEQPASAGAAIPIWVRSGWRDTLSSVETDARQAGTESPLITVFLPKRDADELDEALAAARAATTTLQVKGVPSNPEGREARQAMETRKTSAESQRQSALEAVLEGARVFLAGGQEYMADSLAEAVREAATHALERMYPKFEIADDSRWGRVLNRARGGDAGALDEMGYRGNVEKHPVCEAVLGQVSSSTKGRAVRRHFGDPPHGWPKDAVDASLALLTLTSHVQARRNGETLDASDLDQRKIGKTNFRAETVTISPGERIQARGLLDSLVEVHPGEEEQAIPAFLKHVRRLAERAGGPPPLPPEPDPEYVNEVERLSGNEQLKKLLDYKERFYEDTSAWPTRENRRSVREKTWEQLRKALGHAEGLEAAGDLRRQKQAIESNRSLLEESDPVQPVLKQTTSVLREALTERREACEAEFERQREQLESSETWQELGEDTRRRLLTRYDLADLPSIDASTTEALLRSLDQRSLEGWETLRDALPRRAQRALEEAAQELEPDTVHVSLSSRVLRDASDVEDWLDETRKKLMEQVKDTPVQV